MVSGPTFLEVRINHLLGLRDFVEHLSVICQFVATRGFIMGVCTTNMSLGKRMGDKQEQRCLRSIPEVRDMFSFGCGPPDLQRFLPLFPVYPPVSFSVPDQGVISPVKNRSIPLGIPEVSCNHFGQSRCYVI